MLSRNPAVSVVVPVYNAERYLGQCLDSLASQTLPDIEFICVDDGSTDSSGELLREYARRDARFTVISKPNGGYGHAMNTGLARACGEYVGIVEPDDFASPEMFASLYRTARATNADIVKSNYLEYREEDCSDEFMEVLFDVDYNKVTSAWDDEKVVLRRPCIWSAIYRREMLEGNSIAFNETPGASYQDTAFAFQALVCAERIVFVEEAYLHYRMDNADSSVNSGGKVFSVCDELHLMDAFLNADVRRRERFSAVLNVLRLDTYWWNYHRIADGEMREKFRVYAALEFEKARCEGFLDMGMFSEDRLEMLAELCGNSLF